MRESPADGSAWRRAAILALALGAALGACKTLKPYEKEYLLNPAMDDATVSKASPQLMQAAVGGFEKLGAGGAGQTGGTSCPTCGG